MDYGQIISGLTPTLIYIIPISILLLLIKSPRVKGWFGELLVTFSVKVRLDKNVYHLINNVTMPTEDGSTQIDHIIVSKFGIFVIETKFMKGWIYGSEKRKQWTQKIYKKSFEFQNPLHQNYKHHKTLESVLDIDPQTIFSVIVFTGDSTFKTKLPENVTHAGGVISYIKSKSEVLLDENKVIQIQQQIAKSRLTANRHTHKKHIEHVRDIINKKEIPESTTAVNKEKICPKNVSSSPEKIDITHIDDPTYAGKDQEKHKKVTTSKLAAILKLKTPELIEILGSGGYIKIIEDDQILEKKGKEAGGEEKSGRFGKYFLWPNDFNPETTEKA